MDMMEIRRRVMSAMASGGDTFVVPEGVEIGVFSPTTDVLEYTVNHNLGEIPKVAVVLCVLNDDYSEMASYSGSPLVIETFGADPANGEFDREAASGHKIDNIFGYNKLNSALYSTASWTTYVPEMTSTYVKFTTGRYYSVTFCAGLKYLYVIAK